MPNMRVIEPETTEWSGTLFFVPKKYGSLRLYINYQTFNSVDVRESYPIPRKKGIMHRLPGRGIDLFHQRPQIGVLVC